MSTACILLLFTELVRDPHILFAAFYGNPFYALFNHVGVKMAHTGRSQLPHLPLALSIYFLKV